MAPTDRKEVQSSSTVEAIRMASASVLGVTTGLGYPVGSAIGTGNVLEEHSETASMNIAPLVFSVRDTLQSAENLELLSIEWNLEQKPGPEVVPEQLVVAGGMEGGTGSHVCVLTWERGVVDPFKIDAYMRTLSKKIADIETAVINNEISYEPDGVAVLRSFADRLNSVLFVDMIDRRFQGSWDSQQVKAEHVDVDLEAKMIVRDDFTTMPPGPRLVRRKQLEFRLPPGSVKENVERFKNRVMTPSAVRALTNEIPELGQSILREINEYAYSQEEADIAKGVIAVLKAFLQKDEISLNDLGPLRSKMEEFGSSLKSTANGLEHLIEEHLSSGQLLKVDGHRQKLLSNISDKSDSFSGVKKQVAEAIVNEMMNSIEREYPSNEEIRAWELKSTLRYSIDYAKRISQYFTDELVHYLLTAAAKNAFQAALAEFRQEVLTPELDSTDATLFEKFYGEVKSQLNACFAKIQLSQREFTDLSDLMEAVTREMIEVFRLTDVWSLIDFADVSRVARAEIEKKYSVPQGSGSLTDQGKSLMGMLESFRSLVSETIPDVADTILSRQLIRRMIDRMIEHGTDVVEELSQAVEGAAEKPDVWKSEASEWVQEFRAEGIAEVDDSKALLALLQFTHEKLGAAVTPSAMADRVKLEADMMEQQYQKKVEEWNEIRVQIETENARIRETNEKREELIRAAKEKHEARLNEYEARLRHYQDLVEQRRVESLRVRAPESGEGDGPSPPEPGTSTPLPDEPPKPESIEPQIQAIESQYPKGETKQVPPKPEPDPLLTRYVELRDLLHEKLAEMKEREKSMEETFAKRVLRLKAEGMDAASSVSIDIGPGLLEHLMESRIRRLGRLLPRVSRVYLRDPRIPDLVYLVSYKQFDDTLSISVGSTELR
jgi:hypothetical protein